MSSSNNYAHTLANPMSTSATPRKTTARPRPAWSPQSAPANQRLVKINFKFMNGHEDWVAQTFPLSLLRQYSKLAQQELPQLGQGRGNMNWDIAWPLDEPGRGELAISAGVTIMKWMKLVLPGRGYSPNYLGHPQLEGANLDFGVLVRILVAMNLLDMAAPLDDQRVIPDKIKQYLTDQVPTPSELLLIMSLAGTRYEHLLTKALNRAVNYYDDSFNEHGATQADLEEMVKARADHPGLDQAMTDIEGKKERQRQENQARRQKREEDLAIREQRNRDRFDRASQGLGVLRDDDVKRMLSRDQ